MARHTNNVYIEIDPKKDNKSMNEFMKTLLREKRGEKPVKKKTLTKRNEQNALFSN